ncbi:MAG: radical SAM protein, partial [Nitrospirota bacterium]|nr:radical SAM protein [Nitrospirota bacterium]
MKITFLTPPPLDGKPAAERIFGCNYGIYTQQNIFILYPATVLKNKGYNIAVLDCPIENMNEKALRDFLRTDDSSIYVFYTVFLSKKTDLIARDIIRGLRKRVQFIYLGTEPTVSPQDFMASDSFVIRGEPELTISELLEGIEGRRPLKEIIGITSMDGGHIRENPSRGVIADLDLLPFPDRNLLKKADYHNPKLSKRPFTTIISSRGCAYRCYYCVPNSLDFAREIEFKKYDPTKKKPPVRMRSAENVIEEMKMLYSQGFRSISFLDDQFVWNSQRIMDICKGIKDMGIEWSCLARADHLTNEEVVKAMAEAGCKYIDIGVESFDQKILDYIHKDLKVEDVYKAVGFLKRYGIEPE